MKLKNISGETREFEENGFIYEFPFPSDNPTEVPDAVAEKLLATGQFEEVGTSKKKKDKIFEDKEVDEDAI